jgi:hypothetical protein
MHIIESEIGDAKVRSPHTARPPRGALLWRAEQAEQAERTERPRREPRPEGRGRASVVDDHLRDCRATSMQARRQPSAGRRNLRARVPK